MTTDTISRWLKLVLHNAGIDTRKFTGYSTRAASTSAAKRCDVPIMTIMNSAGWSNVTTFKTYYNKPVTENPQNFGHLLLSSCSR